MDLVDRDLRKIQQYEALFAKAQMFADRKAKRAAERPSISERPSIPRSLIDEQLQAVRTSHQASISSIESCPILTPTAEEFAAPMQYILRHRQLGEEYGVLCIQPPDDWKPPYRYDFDNPQLSFECKKQSFTNAKRIYKKPKLATSKQENKYFDEENKPTDTPQSVAHGDGDWPCCDIAMAVDEVEVLPAITVLSFDSASSSPLSTPEKLINSAFPSPATPLCDVSALLNPHEILCENAALQITATSHKSGMTMSEFKLAADRAYSKWSHKAKLSIPSDADEWSRQDFAEEQYATFAYFGDEHQPTVYYANDVDTHDYLRTPTSVTLTHPDHQAQSKHPWDLSLFARHPSGVLQYIDKVVPGVTEPMLYIGMLFSTFTWHFEDHQFYSISYNHCGQPKTWYTVPASHCEQLEEIVKTKLYPFYDHERQHILAKKTSMFSPALLTQRGIPVYKARQAANTFVITFPRAYHSGFSHGFSFAESVNFALPDWFKYGYESMQLYRRVNRWPVISHHDIIFKALANVIRQDDTAPTDERMNTISAHAWDINFLEQLHAAALQLVKDEIGERRALFKTSAPPRDTLTLHLRNVDRAIRFCQTCKHAAALSFIRCDCKRHSEVVVCIKHCANLKFRSVCRECSSFHLFITKPITQLMDDIQSLRKRITLIKLCSAHKTNLKSAEAESSVLQPVSDDEPKTSEVAHDFLSESEEAAVSELTNWEETMSSDDGGISDDDHSDGDMHVGPPLSRQMNGSMAVEPSNIASPNVSPNIYSGIKSAEIVGRISRTMKMRVKVVRRLEESASDTTQAPLQAASNIDAANDNAQRNDETAMSDVPTLMAPFVSVM